ncbi:MAG: YlxR family protein [Clostridia bacterium]|nr:YlxR family protein [Clostridia bacterium]
MYIPLRMCAACREHKPKSELIRLKAADGIAVPDTDKVPVGRGVYICKSEACIRLAEKKRAVSRHLKAQPCEGLYRLLEGMI